LTQQVSGISACHADFQSITDEKRLACFTPETGNIMGLLSPDAQHDMSGDLAAACVSGEISVEGVGKISFC
jgi:hypothetical protein